mgnify:CR=1 FL=1
MATVEERLKALEDVKVERPTADAAYEAKYATFDKNQLAAHAMNAPKDVCLSPTKAKAYIALRGG